jgi:Abnormal spindle-like microcephaly-assoc'd, ASPM-SPD-2-Hydin
VRRREGGVDISDIAAVDVSGEKRMQIESYRSFAGSVALLCALFAQASAAKSNFLTTAAGPAVSPPIQYDSDLQDTVAPGVPVVAHFTFSATAPVTINGAALAGTNGASYSIVSNTCNGVVLQGAVTCEIDVNVNAAAAYLLTETLVLATSDGPFSADVSVNVEPFPLVVAPSKIDFGTVTIGSSATKNLVFSNPNPIDISLDQYYYGGVQSFDFHGDVSLCDNIPANGTCTVPVTFAPTVDQAEGETFFAVTQYRTEPPSYASTSISLAGTGVMPGGTSVALDAYYNVNVSINEGSITIPDPGIDGAGNVYAFNLLPSKPSWSGHEFFLSEYGVTGASINLPSGHYYAVSVLATGVNGNHMNQPFVVTYMDGTSEIVRQSLSDWKTPQH